MKHKCENCKYQNWNGIKKGNQCYIPVKSKLNKWTGITPKTKYINNIFPDKNNCDGKCIYFKSNITFKDWFFIITIFTTIYVIAIVFTFALLCNLGVI